MRSSKKSTLKVPKPTRKIQNCKIHPNVTIGKNAVIEDFVIIGTPPRGKKSGELPTTIGDNAVIRSHTVIYAGNSIGNSFQTGHHVMVREENNIGDNVSIGTSSVVEHHVTIGDDVRIHTNAFINSGPYGTTCYISKPDDVALARMIETHLANDGTKDDGVVKSHLYVTLHTKMPAVLVEMAFLTNPNDLALLGSPAWRQKVAQEIADGIGEYSQRYPVPNQPPQ